VLGIVHWNFCPSPQSISGIMKIG